jgi:hypothetical protein
MSLHYVLCSTVSNSMPDVLGLPQSTLLMVGRVGYELLSYPRRIPIASLHTPTIQPHFPMLHCLSSRSTSLPPYQIATAAEWDAIRRPTCVAQADVFPMSLLPRLAVRLLHAKGVETPRAHLSCMVFNPMHVTSIASLAAI